MACSYQIKTQRVWMLLAIQLTIAIFGSNSRVQQLLLTMSQLLLSQNMNSIKLTKCPLQGRGKYSQTIWKQDRGIPIFSRQCPGLKINLSNMPKATTARMLATLKSTSSNLRTKVFQRKISSNIQQKRFSKKFSLTCQSHLNNSAKSKLTKWKRNFKSQTSIKL